MSSDFNIMYFKFISNLSSTVNSDFFREIFIFANGVDIFASLKISRL